MILHAGLIAWRRQGVLILGEPGAGKSDLALRCLALGFQLVADDRVIVWDSGGRAFGRAPDTIAGLIEVRGQGPLCATYVPLCEIVLVARCADVVERLPEPQVQDVAGVQVPALDIRPLEASAPAKLSRALMSLGERR